MPDTEPHNLREVTLLFADMRNSSVLAASLELEQSYALLSDVLESLTFGVLDQAGVIIDYYGDGLAAMWNAPDDQPPHAELACRAAITMLESLATIESQWATELKQPLQLGIGIHTGVARVGNSGSSHKWKYGPRGNNVTVASRVEAATKQIGVPLVVSEQTASQLSARFIAPRLCRVRLPGIHEPLELHGVWRADDEPSEMATYELALAEFEAGQLDEAAAILASVDAAATKLPVDFLRTSIERAKSQRHGRRASDRNLTADTAGAILLDVK
jgi:adenylate cyclase